MRIAVVGSGISGLGAAWLLSQEHDVRLFEKQDRIGGHSNTVDVDFGHSRVPVDTGFIVYNDLNYPNLIGLFSALGVKTKGSEMTFSVSLRDKQVEYEGSLRGFTAQPSNLLSSRYWSMLNGLRKFYANAYQYSQDTSIDLSLGDFIKKYNFSDAFVHDHLLPMGAAIWSCPVDTMREFPARSFIQFMENHKLMNYIDRPVWRTVDGGSRQYVEKIVSALGDRIETNCTIRQIKRSGSGVLLTIENEGDVYFDKVIMASHADESLPLIADASDKERVLLSSFTFQENRVILHSDPALMPKRKAVWAAWNYLTSAKSTGDLSVTYWMNKLQSIDNNLPLFVTLNPFKEPSSELVHREFSYDHPVFDGPAIKAQAALGEIQGQNHIYHCGAWTRYGFHEDGLSSAVRVAKSFGVSIPWDSPSLAWHDVDEFATRLEA